MSTPLDPAAQTTAEYVVREPPEENGDALTFSFPLEVDEIRSNELGGRATLDWRSLHRERSSDWIAPSKDDKPREEDFIHQLDVIESRPAKLHFKVSLQVVEFGYGGNSNSHCCLLVFNLSIHNISSRERFSEVSIGIEFRDADPDTSSGSSRRRRVEDSRNDPRILAIAPGNETGERTAAPATTAFQYGIGAAGMLAIAGTTIANEQHSRAKVRGSIRRRSQAYWTLAENDITKGGAPEEMTCAIRLEIRPEKRFLAKFTVSAELRGTVFKNHREKEEETLCFSSSLAAAPSSAGGVSVERPPAGYGTNGWLVGGTLRMGDTMFMPRSEEPIRDLSGVDLESLSKIVWA